MFKRFCFGVLLLAGFAVPFTGCNISNGLDSITVSPSTASMVVGGPTLGLTATGTFGNAAHASSQNITDQVTWTSASPEVAQVGASTGMVTAEAAGTAIITASSTGFNGPVSSSVTITVTGGSGTGSVSSEGLVSLTIIPSSITVGQLQDTGNFLAIGTYTTDPKVRDVTNSVVWTSSFPNVFPVDTNTGGDTGATAGIVTAYGSGTNATIMAEVTDPVTQSIQYATATFSCPLVMPCTAAQGCTPPVAGSCFPGSQALSLLSTLTIYNEGANKTNWLVTASSATGTPDVIHCGPGWTGTGGSVCVGTYPPIDTPVILTATQTAGSTGTFGGWSYNCTPIGAVTAAGPNQCTVVLGEPNPNYGLLTTDPNYNPNFPGPTVQWLTSNVTVGAIFN